MPNSAYLMKSKLAHKTMTMLQPRPFFSSMRISAHATFPLLATTVVVLITFESSMDPDQDLQTINPFNILKYVLEKNDFKKNLQTTPKV